MQTKPFGTLLVLSILLFSCKKGAPPQLPDDGKDLKTLNSPPPLGTITLRTVTLHSRIGDVTFGWEWVSRNDNGGQIRVSDIRSGVGGGGAGWVQTQTLWSNVAANPNVVTIVIYGTHTYISKGSFGADTVRDVIEVYITYDVMSHVQTVVERTITSTMITRQKSLIK